MYITDKDADTDRGSVRIHDATDVLNRLTADDLRNTRTTSEEIDRIGKFLVEREIDLAALIGFVTRTLAPLFANRTTELSNIYWCPKWWYHLDALDRFDILLKVYATAADAELRSDWWLNYAKPHMDDLMVFIDSPCGFYNCTPRNGHRYGRSRPLFTDLPTVPASFGLAAADIAA